MSKESFEKTLGGLENWAVQAMNRHLLAGMALGVVRDGQMVYARGFGHADIAAGRPITPATIFRIASISKTFTAIGLMKLWEQGRFDLDDPIMKYLKAFRVVHRDPQAPPITFRHLLTHTSGIGETRNLRETFDTFVLNKHHGATRPGEPVMPLATYMQGELTPDSYPGEKWAYANLGYATLGQLIEELSGKPFPEYMIETVFEPLGMHRSDFLLSERVQEGLAVGYVFKNGRMLPAPQVYLPRLAARAIHTNLENMALYVSGLMNGTRNAYGSVLNPETLELMFAPHYQKDAHLSGMGLGFYVEYLDGIQCVSHDGNLDGFCSSMMVAPQEKLGLIMLVNTTSQVNYALSHDLMRRLLDLPDLSKRLPHVHILKSAHLWEQLCGHYGLPRGFNSNLRKWMMFGGEFEVYVKNNRLMMRSLAGMLKDGIELFPADANDPLVFEAVAGGILATLVFKRNLTGVIDRIYSSGGEFLTLYKQPFTKSLRFRLRAGAGGVIGSLLLLGIFTGLKRMRK